VTNEPAPELRAEPDPAHIDTPAWVRDAVFYQIFPDRFARSERVTPSGPLEPWDAPPTYHGFKGGDLLGIVERLPDLAELGVNALYLTPVFSSGSNHRYHAYDYLAVDPLLGGTPALRELLDTAHGMGIRVVLDGVFNHCGRGFWQFHHVLENGAGSPYRAWFVLDHDVMAGARQLNAYPDRGRAQDQSLGYQAWWGAPALPKLNVSNPEVREYLLSVAETWLRFGIDGWRLDVPTEIDDPTFWPEFRRRCRAVNPDAYLVGEIWDVAPEWLTGDRFDALMNYPIGAAILGFAGGPSLDLQLVSRHDIYSRTVRPLDGHDFAARVEHLLTVYHPAVTAVLLNLLGSHDAPRALSVLSGNVAAFRLATLLQMVLPGAPCIYYGDEVGLEGGLDPDNRRGFPQSLSDAARELRTFVSAAVAARREHAALRDGIVSVARATDRSVVLLREGAGERAVVAVNAGGTPEHLEVEIPWDMQSLDDVALPEMPPATTERDPAEARSWHLTLPPMSGSILVAR